MLYTDNAYKFVAVLNRKFPLSRLFNASLHIAAGLAGGASDELRKMMQFHDYYDSTGTLKARVSHYPFIVLEAKNGNQLKTLSASARQHGIACSDFVDAMLGCSAEAQLEATRNSDDSSLECIAVCLFGASEELDPLTRKFSLFKREENSAGMLEAS